MSKPIRDVINAEIKNYRNKISKVILTQDLDVILEEFADVLEDTIQNKIGDIVQANESNLRQKHIDELKRVQCEVDKAKDRASRNQQELKEAKERNDRLHWSIKAKDGEISKLKKDLKKLPISQEYVDQLHDEIGFLRTLLLANSKHGEQ